MSVNQSINHSLNQSIHRTGGDQYRRSKRKKHDVPDDVYIILEDDSEDDDLPAAASANVLQPAVRGNQYRRIPNPILFNSKNNGVIILEDGDLPAASSADKHRVVLERFPNADPDWVRNMLTTTRLTELVFRMAEKGFPIKEIAKIRKKKRFADPFRSGRPLPSDDYFAEGI